MNWKHRQGFRSLNTMVRPNLHQVLIMDPRTNYQQILDNFEEFCDGFEAGAATAFEFSQSKMQFESAQSAWLRAKYDFIFKIKILELYFGIPIADL